VGSQKKKKKCHKRGGSLSAKHLGEKEGRKERKKEREGRCTCRDSSLLARFALTRTKFAMGEVTIVRM
jgi:hypothetical protein